MAPPTVVARQNNTNSGGGNNTNTGMVAAVAVIGGILVLIIVGGVASCFVKARRAKKHQRLNSRDDTETPSASNGPSRPSNPGGRNNRSSMFSTNRMSVRSIRSIISLPAYKETASEHEEVIARAGEREGLDYIVEGPETEDDVESQRQEEMSTIYQVQLTRRRELEERNERRAARREALNRQDYREVARLDRAAAEARQRQNSNSNNLSVDENGQYRANSTDLIASLQEIRNRPRRVSEVAYGEIGRARHDGSRVRNQSIDNDSQPLLDSSASMGRGSIDTPVPERSRASSVTSHNQRGGASRPTTRERSRSRASRNGGSDDTEEMTRRLSDGGIPPDPPSYDDDLTVHAGEAPRYEDIVRRNSQRQAQLQQQQLQQQQLQQQQQASSPTTSTSSNQQHTPTSEESGAAHQSYSDEQVSPTHIMQTTVLSPVAESRESIYSAVPPRLQTRNITDNGRMAPPAIEVQTATPVHSQPGTPTSNRFSRHE